MTSVIAHRGQHGPGVFENSRAAILEACRRGHGSEIDVRATRDGALVLSHDDSLARVYGKPGVIRESRRADVPELCLFQEAVADAAAHRVRLFVHVKEFEVLGAVCGYLREQGQLAECILFGDNEQSRPVVDACLKEHRKAQTALHITSAAAFRESAVLALDRIWLDEVPGAWITEETVRIAHERRWEVYTVCPEVWHSGCLFEYTLAKWRQWAAWGVDGICTDLPQAMCDWQTAEKRGA